MDTKAKLVFFSVALFLIVALTSFIYSGSSYTGAVVTGNTAGGAIAAATQEQAWLGVISLIAIIALAVVSVISFHLLSKRK